MTALLIFECFELTNAAIRTKECEVRLRELQKVMTILCKTLEQFRVSKAPRLERTIRGMLNRNHKFAGFTRTYVRTQLEQYPELAQYVA